MNRVALAQRVLSARPRDAKGRFTKGPTLAERVNTQYEAMGGRAACGKKQYKSAVCKAKAIMAAAEQGQQPSSAQVAFVTRVAKNAFSE